MRKFMKDVDEKGYTFLESIFQLIIIDYFSFIYLLLFFFWKGPIEQQLYGLHPPLSGNYFQLDLQISTF